MTNYTVPAAYGRFEFTEKRSRFIGNVWPVDSEEAALKRIGDMRKENEDASHNVYAYSIRNGVMRFSDDGEPGGTGGNPVLNVFIKAGVDNFCCVVTRYFGGILLGAGGLVRAYSKAAAGALGEAGMAEIRPWSRYTITCSYGSYDRLRNNLELFGVTVESVDYTDSVTIHAIIPEADETGLDAFVAEKTAGTASIQKIGMEYRA